MDDSKIQRAADIRDFSYEALFLVVNFNYSLWVKGNMVHFKHKQPSAFSHSVEECLCGSRLEKVTVVYLLTGFCFLRKGKKNVFTSYLLCVDSESVV